MGSYVDDSLGNGEALVYAARVSLWRYWLNFVLGGLVLVAALPKFVLSLFGTHDATQSALGTGLGLVSLLAVVVFFWPFIARKSTELVITDKRVIAKFGILATHSIEMRFDKVETVRVTQSLIGKLLNYGDIVVTGTGSTFDPIPNISSPLAFRTALNQAMELGKP